VLTAWVFQPHIARQATDAGFVGDDESMTVADD